MERRPRILALAALAVAGCTGTPMPIPPSFTPERMAATPVEDTPECAEGCVAFEGLEGVTDPGNVVVLHRLEAMREVPPELAPSALAIADAAGNFFLTLGGGPDGSFRAIVHGDDGFVVSNFTLDTGVEPWTPAPIEDAGLAECIGVSPPQLDFGVLPVGGTETEVVVVRNGCGSDVVLEDVGVIAPPASDGEPAYDAMVRRTVLTPGESTSVVVAYWPGEAGPHRGALIFVTQYPDRAVTLLPSIPVRGEAD